MTFKAFIFGMLASFGLPWLFAIVLPFATMNSLEPVEFEEGNEEAQGVYQPKRDGRVTEGSIVYGQEGCYQCHSQLIRPTYAGNDLHRDGWAGFKKTIDLPDTRRETLPQDFAGERIAHIGNNRVGPDLANLGRRLEFHLAKTNLDPETWLFQHLYAPRKTPNYRRDAKGFPSQDIATDSTCPAKKGLFKMVPAYQGRGQAINDSPSDSDLVVVPTDRARILVSYLSSLKKDTFNQPLPEELNFKPAAK